MSSPKLTPAQRALVLQFEPVGRAYASRIFDRLKGRLPTGEEGDDALAELFQAAHLGTVKAALRFDPTRVGERSGRPVSFAPFARSWVKWEINEIVKADYHTPLPERVEERYAAPDPEEDPGPDVSPAVRELLSQLPPDFKRITTLWQRGVTDLAEIAAALEIDLDDDVRGLVEELRAALAPALAPLLPRQSTRHRGQVYQAQHVPHRLRFPWHLLPEIAGLVKEQPPVKPIPPRRHALELREQGMSYREIGAAIGCSPMWAYYLLNARRTQNQAERTQNL